MSSAGIRNLLAQLAQLGGSDLHLGEGVRPRIRLHGELKDLNHPPLDRQTLYGYMESLVGQVRFRKFLETGDLDFAWEWEEVARFRINYFVGNRGLGSVMRLVPETVIPFRQLHLPDTIVRFTQRRSGLILLTGPTGSGKSTTLAAMLDHINRTRATHIITIEDPIEFVHRRQRSFISQREIGTHTRTFGSALRAAIREDPDVLMVGELRDTEATALALTAAEMGFLVLATLHSGSAAKTIDRIVDMFPVGRRSVIRAQLASTLVGVINQTLLRRVDGQGRVPACEVLVSTKQLQTMIREGATHQIPSAFQQGVAVGCRTMDQSIRSLLGKGLITKRDAYFRLEDKTGM